MPTYKQIQNHTRRTRHFVPKPCWIAQILSDHDLTEREAYNRLNHRVRQHPCPAEKRASLEAAMRELGVFA